MFVAVLIYVYKLNYRYKATNVATEAIHPNIVVKYGIWVFKDLQTAICSTDEFSPSDFFTENKNSNCVRLRQPFWPVLYNVLDGSSGHRKQIHKRSMSSLNFTLMSNLMVQFDSMLY